MIQDPRPCVLCLEKHPPIRREGLAVPVIVVPVLRWPIPAYMQFRGAICRRCLVGFNLNKFTDYFGSWYDMVGDHLRSMRRPAQNPFPDDPSFNWESWIINPNYEPAPREQCVLQFWDPKTMGAKGAKAKLWT